CVPNFLAAQIALHPGSLFRIRNPNQPAMADVFQQPWRSLGEFCFSHRKELYERMSTGLGLRHRDSVRHGLNQFQIGGWRVDDHRAHPWLQSQFLCDRAHRHFSLSTNWLPSMSLMIAIL